MKYKAYKDGLLFSNGNFYPKVYDRAGNWKYDFRTQQVESEESTIDVKMEVTEPVKPIANKEWLIF